MTIIFLLILTAAIEMTVFIEAGQAIGAIPVVGLCLLTAAIGLTLIREQGLSVLLRAEERLRAAALPAREIFDGLCLAVAGFCLLTPGFVTDTLGFALLIPPLRAALWPHIRTKMIRSGVLDPMDDQPAGPPVIEGDFVQIDRDDPRLR